MRYDLFAQRKDSILLIARVLLVVLFVLFGWSKLTGFSGTVEYMSSTGVPVPEVSAIIAVVMEFFVGLAIVVGFYARPLAVLLALYTLGTAFIGHHFWNMTGSVGYDNMIHFYKNISIFGGLLFLAASGPGKYSFDRK
jgi:putative oxidoreductase